MVTIMISKTSIKTHKFTHWLSSPLCQYWIFMLLMRVNFRKPAFIFNKPLGILFCFLFSKCLGLYWYKNYLKQTKWAWAKQRVKWKGRHICVRIMVNMGRSDACYGCSSLTWAIHTSLCQHTVFGSQRLVSKLTAKCRPWGVDGKGIFLLRKVLCSQFQ